MLACSAATGSLTGQRASLVGEQGLDLSPYVSTGAINFNEESQNTPMAQRPSVSAGPVRISVLLYSGPGSSASALSLARLSLSRLLNPSRYAISSVTTKELLGEPWPASTALLVFPGGRDELYCQDLNGAGNVRIRRYVEGGGRYLGLCAGGYYGAARCEWRADKPAPDARKERWDVAGPRELSFFPGTCRGTVKAGFRYQSEIGARAVRIRPSETLGSAKTKLKPFRAYLNGGGVYVGADSEEMKVRGVEPLAFYDEDIDVDAGAAGAAVVYCKVGQGQVALTGPHPEFDADSLDKEARPGYDKLVESLQEDDQDRLAFLRALLEKLGLELNNHDTSIPQLSKLHLSSSTHNAKFLVDMWKNVVVVGADGARYIQDEGDTFRLEPEEDTFKLDSLAKTLPQLEKRDKADLEATQSRSSSPSSPFSALIKRVVVHSSEPPSVETTPSFDHAFYFAELTKYQSLMTGSTGEKRGVSLKDSQAFGTPLLYGAVVTSTNTLLEKNPKLLCHLPTGFTAAATQQIAGRGRGSNAWVSPAGSLMFSVVIRHPAAQMQKAPVVFLQYLAGMAVVEGVRAYDASRKEYASLPVRLKWPNDIYVLDPATPKDDAGKDRYVKIGGVLVNSSYSPADAEYVCVVGIGLNVKNVAPTTSLSALLPETQPRLSFSLESLQASILASFAGLYARFVAAGFDRALEDRYYASWLHSGQVVTLESEGGTKARIRGITTDWGMLEAEELNTASGWFGEGQDGWRSGGASAPSSGRVIRLQSDGNSFDFMKGLVRRKV